MPVVSRNSVASAAFLAVLLRGGQAAEIFVAPDGSGSGSLDAPFGSIQDAVDAAAAGDIIYLRAGTYAPTSNIQITTSGEATAPITLRPYEDEVVVLDGEELPG